MLNRITTPLFTMSTEHRCAVLPLRQLLKAGASVNAALVVATAAFQTHVTHLNVTPAASIFDERPEQAAQRACPTEGRTAAAGAAKRARSAMLIVLPYERLFALLRMRSGNSNELIGCPAPRYRVAQRRPFARRLIRATNYVTL